ncbi:MAG: Fe-S oxidoreductase [Candidatus Rifleibacterium amylolyticum]|nr:MAG: Fe-S oxidoreductase [Candidatus Rifleibacterium amylolyticum]
MINVTESITHWELLEIEKPARYLGGEVNQATIKASPDLRVCLVFPDLYDLGMSNLAIKIFYEKLNAHPQIMAERAFSPWSDFEQLLRRKNLPLYSLETGTPLHEFDALLITLPYEMTFTNVLNLLDLGKIDLKWQTRKEGPIVIAGGPSASNPLPMARFMDAVLIGDGEEAILEICETLIRTKKANAERSDVRKELSKIEGMWVPEFTAPVKRRVFKGFAASTPPVKPLLPNVQTIHNRATLEIFRGCIQGCRFCNAGFYYRPKRERPVEDLVEYARQLLQNSGEESLGLLSLSTSDYSHLTELVNALDQQKLYPEQNVSIPSLRMNESTIELLDSTPHIRKGGLTFAPEAGTQRLRNVIKKNISEDDIISVMRATSGSDYRTVKLYFMMGLPFETDADIEGIVDLVRRLEDIGRTCRPRKQISISLSGFVPKPFTPFQWAAQADTAELRRKRLIVCRGLERSGSKVSWREEFLCLLESVLSRGDERVGELILKAWELGCRFDGWHEHFSRSKWEQAFTETGIDAAVYLRERRVEETLPWDFVNFQVPRAYLESEYAEAARAAEEVNNEPAG